MNDQEPGKLNIKELIDLEDFIGAKEIMLKKLDFNLKNCKDLIKEDLKNKRDASPKPYYESLIGPNGTLDNS